MPGKPAVLLDTSTLRGTSLDSAPFRTLLELSKADLIEICIPELVAEERRTQWRDKRAEALRSGANALAALLADPLLTDTHREPVRAALEALRTVDIERASREAYDNWFTVNGMTKVPLSFAQAKEAWASYFTGAPPHRKVKSREDIPDAHILAAARELLGTHKQLQCVSNDKVLGSALSALNGVAVYSSIDDLLQAEPFTAARAHWERDKVWQQIIHKVSFPDLKEVLRDLLEESGGDFLEGHEFTDRVIPEDNHAAQISWAGGVELVEISNPDDWGGGLLSFDVSFVCEAGLSFLVYRAVTDNLPDWVDISWGDPDEHYLDATGDVLLSVEAVITAQVDLSTVEGGAPSFSDWKLEPSRIGVASTP